MALATGVHWQQFQLKEPGEDIGSNEGGPKMIVVRFKVKCRPDKTDAAAAAFREVIAASRPVKGIVSFDIGHDLADQNSFIATEVFEDRAALDRQEALPAVKKTIGLLEQLVAEAPEATIYHVSSSEPWG
ncbi:MAG: putative quinol monooxygenase [Hyphomicrobiales bacterium]